MLAVLRYQTQDTCAVRSPCLMATASHSACHTNRVRGRGRVWVRVRTASHSACHTGLFRLAGVLSHARVGTSGMYTYMGHFQNDCAGPRAAHMWAGDGVGLNQWLHCLASTTCTPAGWLAASPAHSAVTSKPGYESHFTHNNDQSGCRGRR